MDLPLTLMLTLAGSGLCLGLVGGLSLSNRRLTRRIRASLRTEGTSHITLSDILQGLRALEIEVERLKDKISSDQELRENILDALPIAVVIATLEGTITLSNKAARELFPTLKLSSKPRTIEGALRNAALSRLFDQLKTTHLIEPRDIALIGQDHRLLRVGGSRLGYREDADAVILVLEEVTERRRAERIRREFIGNISHELRTPITALLATSEMLIEGIDDAEQERRFIGAIRRHATRLHILIRDLLTLSRLDEPTAIRTLQREDTNIRDLCSSVMQTVQESSEQWNPAMNLTITISEDVPVTARLHRTLMQHALINLVENASQHVGPDGVISLTASRDNESLTFSVIDNGSGIPAEHLPRLFERFYRVDKGRSRQTGGSGIGLAIVKHVAAAHGGTVAVTSAVGTGSTFSVTIPLDPHRA